MLGRICSHIAHHGMGSHWGSTRLGPEFNRCLTSFFSDTEPALTPLTCSVYMTLVLLHQSWLQLLRVLAPVVRVHFSGPGVVSQPSGVNASVDFVSFVAWEASLVFQRCWVVDQSEEGRATERSTHVHHARHSHCILDVSTGCLPTPIIIVHFCFMKVA